MGTTTVGNWLIENMHIHVSPVFGAMLCFMLTPGLPFKYTLRKSFLVDLTS